jgi:hypothetical protein
MQVTTKTALKEQSLSRSARSTYMANRNEQAKTVNMKKADQPKGDGKNKFVARKVIFSSKIKSKDTSPRKSCELAMISGTDKA